MACNSCNPCNTCPSTNPCSSNKCLGTITSADLGELVYIAGLDVNLCKKYSTIIDAMGLLDCAGNPISSATPLVTCTAFQGILCDILGALTAGDPVAAGTVLLGADCQSHLMPAFQAPITVLDTTSIDLTFASNVLSGVVRLSDDAGQIIEIRADGLYANVCDGIEGLSAGSAIAAGTVLVGADCQTHAMPAFQAPISVQDTTCLDLTFAGNVISGSPVVSPTAGNQLSCSGNGLYVAATDVTISATDTPCLDLTVTESPANTFVITGSPVISPTANNAITCSGNGLYAPALDPYPGTAIGIQAPADVYLGATTANQVFVSPIFTLNVVNPSATRSAVLHLAVRFPQIQCIGSTPTGGDKIEVGLARHINFPSFAAIQGIGTMTVHTEDDEPDFWPGMQIDAPLIIAPGESGTLGVSLNFIMGPTALPYLNIERFILRAWVATI